MKNKTVFVVLCLICCALGSSALAHDTGFSYVDLRLGPSSMEVAVKLPTALLTRDLSLKDPGALSTPEGVAAQRDKIVALVVSRVEIVADGRTLDVEAGTVTIDPQKKAVTLQLQVPWEQVPAALHVRCPLFPDDPEHKTLVSLYTENVLERQEILRQGLSELEYRPNSTQGILPVIIKFIAEGVHHIFIGPDHILFVVGLLLLGGKLRQLLKIVTSFTIAHSITLVLATLDIFNPPSRLVEPAIALSIICIGLDNLVAGKEGRDIRVIIAFCFGLIHGFGFAGVLQELELPRQALGWSLLSFNVGVELGQACIVLAIAPLLAVIYKRSRKVGRWVMVAGSAGVMLMGAYWFVERVSQSG